MIKIILIKLWKQKRERSTALLSYLTEIYTNTAKPTQGNIFKASIILKTKKVEKYFYIGLLVFSIKLVYVNSINFEKIVINPKPVFLKTPERTCHSKIPNKIEDVFKRYPSRHRDMCLHWDVQKTFLGSPYLFNWWFFDVLCH